MTILIEQLSEIHCHPVPKLIGMSRDLKCRGKDSSLRLVSNNQERQILNQVQHDVEVVSVLKKVYLFGSRAMLNHKPSSNVDLCIKGTNLSSSLISHLRYLLNEETNLPCFFDVVDYDSITSQELLKHINDFGIDLLVL